MARTNRTSIIALLVAFVGASRAADVATVPTIDAPLDAPALSRETALAIQDAPVSLPTANTAGLAAALPSPVLGPSPRLVVPTAAVSPVQLNRAVGVLIGPAGALAPGPSRSTPRRALRQLEDLAQLLRSLPLVRISIPNAPGNGHQAVGALIARRVRELGFTGRLEILYPPAVKSKLDVTLRGFDTNGPDAQELPALGAHAVAASGGPLERVPLGIVAASDSGAPDLNADVTVSVQPFGWRAPAVRMEGRLRHYRSMKNTVIAQRPPAPTDLDAFIEDQFGGSQRMREKKESVRALVRHLGQVELLPVYGMSDHPAVLGTLLNGIAIAQDRQPTAFHGGVLVPIFSHVSSFDLGRAVGSLPKQVRGRVRVVFVKEPDAVETELRAARTDEILLVQVGGVPQEVFEYFYSKETLPGTVAGVNAQNMMLSFGLPYLTTHRDAVQGYDATLRRLLTRGRLLSAWRLRLFYRGSTSLTARDDPRDVADAILAIKRPETKRAFGALSATASSRDRVARLLIRALTLASRPRRLLDKLVNLWDAILEAL